MDFKALLFNHKGETFYSPIVGECKLIEVTDYIHVSVNDHPAYCFTLDGKREHSGLCMFFPSEKLYKLYPTDPEKAWEIWESYNKRAIPHTFMNIDEKKLIISEIMQSFNFEKVHAYMKLVDWRWNFNGALKLPTLEDLQLQAYELLNNLSNYNESITCGGFVASAYYDNNSGKLKLDFTIASSGFSKKEIEISNGV